MVAAVVVVEGRAVVEAEAGLAVGVEGVWPGVRRAEVVFIGEEEGVATVAFVKWSL